MAGESSSDRGRRAEQLAIEYLVAQGYRILHHNVRGRRKEIDIIAEEGEVLCFIEVRSRRSAAFGHPLETINARKQAHIIEAARRFLAQYPAHGKSLRFDAVGVVYEPRVEVTLIRGAFEAAGRGAPPRCRW